MRQEIQDLAGLDAVSRAHRFHRLQTAPAREHRDPAEQGALFFGQEVMAPVDRASQRLVAGQPGLAGSGQQLEGVIQPGGDLLDRQDFHPRRRELDRQGMPSSRRHTCATVRASSSMSAK